MNRSAVFGVVALVAALQPAAPPDCACPSSRQFPGGAVDADSRTAFVANPQNGITAVSLDSGSTVWSSTAAMLPVGLTDDAVIALGRSEDPREVQVVLLNRRTGSAALTSRPFRPAYDPKSDRALGSMRFLTSQASSSIVIVWDELAPPAAGVGRDTGTTTRVEGVRMSRAEGAVERLTHSERPRDPAAAVSSPYQRGAEYVAEPWGEGACSRALGSEQQGDLLAVTLLCDPRQGGTTRHELAKARTVAATVSLDGCAIFVETPGPGGRPIWTAYSSQTGGRTGTIPREPSAWNPAIVAGRAYYLVDLPGDGPRTSTLLRAVDLESGAKRWEIPVRGRSVPRAY